MSNITNITKDETHYRITVQLPDGTKKVFSTGEYNEDRIMERLEAIYGAANLTATREIIKQGLD